MKQAKERFERFCEHRRIVARTATEKATKDLMGAAWESAEHGWFMRVKVAVMNLCSCGGGGPDDPHTCPVCKLYHALKIGECENDIN